MVADEMQGKRQSNRASEATTPKRQRKRRRPCDHCKLSRQRCDPNPDREGECATIERALDESPCQQCLAAGLDCTYGQLQKGVYTRTRSYGVVSELDDRLAKVEAALYAKLDSAGYVETSLIELEADLDEENVKPDVTCVSSARPRARNCAEDPVATISAAFDFAASFLPPNPATYGQYVTGLTGAGPGREHLRAVLDQHEAELFALDPLSAGPAVPQEAVLDSLNWRRSSVALSSSSSSSSRGSLSDCAVPDTPMTSVHGSPPRQRLRSLAEDTISSSRSKHKPMISLRKGEAELGQMFPLGSLPPPLLPPPPTPPPCAFPHCVDPFADISYQASPPAPQGFRPFNFQPIPDPAQSPALFLLPPPPVFPSATHSTPFHSRAHPAGLPAALPPPSIPLLPPFRYAF